MKLSIITINRNNAAGLRKTIESVVSQNFTDFEYIIIDGASTDESVEVIKEYAKTPLPYGEGLGERFYWVSEPDNGIYNAMNKGILKANGEYCLFLNSGDWLVDEEVVGDFCGLECEEDIISGNLWLWENNEVRLRISLLKEELSFNHFFKDTLPHPATFIKKELFSKYGSYNEENKIVSDWEFFFKCLFVNKSTYNHFDRIISYFDLTGICSQIESIPIQIAEREKVLIQNIPEYLYTAYTKLYDKKVILETHEEAYRDYMNLKNGKLSIFIKFFLYLKRKIK